MKVKFNNFSIYIPRRIVIYFMCKNMNIKLSLVTKKEIYKILKDTKRTSKKFILVEIENKNDIIKIQL